MTILTVPRKDFEKLVGKITPELEKQITDMGTPVEEINEHEVSVEVFPNRPDLLGLRNFAAALNQYRGKRGINTIKVKEAEQDYEVIVEKSVKTVRPHTVCAIVKGLKLTEERILELIDIQEKLHSSIGRKRKKAAIGIYPLDKISLPIRFVGKKSEELVFTPLESAREMNAKQILRNHPTGKEYANLLEGTEVFPAFIDAQEQVLSMPPIINSENTGRITEQTREVFIEVSGHNLEYLHKCLNILVLTFSEMGASIHAMKVKDEKTFTTPELGVETVAFDIEDIHKTLGIELTKKQITGYLKRMGIGVSEGRGNLIAEIPAYRTDILHWIDLVEEVAIAHGYENFEPELPDISTIAEEDKTAKLKRVLSEILAGAGLLEVSSYHLTTKKNIKKAHYEYADFLELEESKTERDVLRMDLMTNILHIFSENSHATYPQKIFELGRVFSHDVSKLSETGISEEERLGIGIIDESVTFTDLKQIVDYLFKMIETEYEIDEIEDSNYISGRVGAIIVNGIEVGRIGEIAPRVLKNWKIKMPIAYFEMRIDELQKHNNP